MNYLERNTKQRTESAAEFLFPDFCKCGAIATYLAVVFDGQTIKHLNPIKKLCPHCCDELEREGLVRRIG